MTEESAFGGGVGYMDGEFKPFSELRVPVTDLGFQFGDTCYDTVQVWDGRFFRLGDHLDRFERSLALGRYETHGYDRDAIAEVLHGCVARAGLQRALATVQVTRGTPGSGGKDLRTCDNLLIAYAEPYRSVVTQEEVETGCDIIVAETLRIPPEAVDPTVKNHNRLDFVRALFEAYEREARYAVLLDGDGHVTEGRGYNVFALIDGELLSPDSGALEGITRKTVLELSERLNIKGRLASITADRLRGADEAFLTSSAGGIMPVKRIDGRPIGDGQPGPVTTRLTEMYWALHGDPAYTTPVKYELAEAS